MFFRLRFPAFRCSDNEKAGIDRTDAGQHVFEELHVAGDVDETDAGSRRQLHMREPKIDSKTASLLFLKAIRVRTRKRKHQGALAVINVTSRGHDMHRAHLEQAAVSAEMIVASSTTSTVRRSRNVVLSRTLAISGGEPARNVAVRSPRMATP